ncbi:MAG: hypothetical protein M1814_005239 [Vezdaea aestivalis]|nr:MAG: hypothetical protein M1814_005239 [Vezdaea aestivalis]
MDKEAFEKGEPQRRRQFIPGNAWAQRAAAEEDKAVELKSGTKTPSKPLKSILKTWSRPGTPETPRNKSHQSTRQKGTPGFSKVAPKAAPGTPFFEESTQSQHRPTRNRRYSVSSHPPENDKESAPWAPSPPPKDDHSARFWRSGYDHRSDGTSSSGDSGPPGGTRKNFADFDYPADPPGAVESRQEESFRSTDPVAQTRPGNKEPFGKGESARTPRSRLRTYHVWGPPAFSPRSRIREPFQIDLERTPRSSVQEINTARLSPRNDVNISGSRQRLETPSLRDHTPTRIPAPFHSKRDSRFFAADNLEVDITFRELPYSRPKTSRAQYPETNPPPTGQSSYVSNFDELTPRTKAHQRKVSEEIRKELHHTPNKSLDTRWVSADVPFPSPLRVRSRQSHRREFENLVAASAELGEPNVSQHSRNIRTKCLQNFPGGDLGGDLYHHSLTRPSRQSTYKDVQREVAILHRQISPRPHSASSLHHTEGSPTPLKYTSPTKASRVAGA